MDAPDPDLAILLESSFATIMLEASAFAASGALLRALETAIDLAGTARAGFFLETAMAIAPASFFGPPAAFTGLFAFRPRLVLAAPAGAFTSPVRKGSSAASVAAPAKTA